VRYGQAKVEVDLQVGRGTMVPGSLDVADERLLFAPGGAPVLGSQTIFDAIRAGMAGANRPTLVIIHGFSNSFTNAIERAAWICVFYGIDANVFAFTWPSRASPVGVPLPYGDYTHDRATAAASGPAIARTIRRLYDYVDALSRELRCRESIHLICHSMGNYVLRNALQALMRLPDAGAAITGDVATMSSLSTDTPDPSVLRRTSDRIVLAAADEDADAFDDAAKLKYLPRIGRAVTVYHTNRDWVLNTLSAVTKFNGPRRGNDGPDNMATISDKVSAVDVSDVTSFREDPQSDQYYRIFPAVRHDIVAVLNGAPQNEVPHRAPISDGRWRIAPGRAASKRSAAKRQRKRPK
jgi:esterase/lipase superfamily enzyme